MNNHHGYVYMAALHGFPSPQRDAGLQLMAAQLTAKSAATPAAAVPPVSAALTARAIERNAQQAEIEQRLGLAPFSLIRQELAQLSSQLGQVNEGLHSRAEDRARMEAALGLTPGSLA